MRKPAVLGKVASDELESCNLIGCVDITTFSPLLLQLHKRSRREIGRSWLESEFPKGTLHEDLSGRRLDGIKLYIRVLQHARWLGPLRVTLSDYRLLTPRLEWKFSCI
jgi:hypothetical protein